MRRKRYDPKVFKRLRKKGLTLAEIAKRTGASLVTVQYHLNPKVREQILRSSREWTKSKRGKAYHRDWFKYRYHQNEEFRKKHIGLVRKRQEQIREERKKRRLRGIISLEELDQKRKVRKRKKSKK